MFETIKSILIEYIEVDEVSMEIAHHSSEFNLDEDVFWKGSAVFVKIASEFLKG